MKSCYEFEDFLYERLTKLRANKGVSQREMSLSMGQSEGYAPGTSLQFSNSLTVDMRIMRLAMLSSLRLLIHSSICGFILLTSTVLLGESY